MPHPTESTGIRDNHLYGKVADFLREKILPGAELSVVSAYFTIFAYHALREKLNTISGLRFLFGEPSFIASLDPSKVDPKSFRIEDDALSLANRLTQRAVARDCAQWLRDKVEIRSVAKANLLHGKLYHLQNGPVSEALLGSSNFTCSGLGINTASNIELNMEVDSKRDTAALHAWFDNLWNDTTLTLDVKDEVLKYLAQLYRDHSPEFVYFKTLFHIFAAFLDREQENELLLSQTSLLETGIWNALFDFQKDGVKGAINKILAHNGCILADSVGLGKTYEALAVIKYFELRNQNTLVLCPKKLRENWTVYLRNDLLNPFVGDRFGFDVLSHTDLSREKGMSGDIDLASLNWANYDLVVIDESHNFRNNTADREDEDGNIIRKSRYSRLLDDILRAGVKSKVLLLSATPVNNTLRDLRNQLYLISEAEDDAFAKTIGVTSLAQTLKFAQQQFTKWAKQPTAGRTTRHLLAALDSGFFKLLDQLTIARSRKHIQRHYKDSLAQIGGFPKRAKPDSVYPQIDKLGRFMPYEKLDEEISKFKLSLYNPFSFVKAEHRHRYEKNVSASKAFTQEGREKILIGMMKIGFLKRLESSVRSFALTMERTDQKIIALINRINEYRPRRTVALSGELGLQIDGELPFESPAADDDADVVGRNFIYQLEHLDLERWLGELQQDRAQIKLLRSQAEAVTADDDAKLGELKKIITQKLTHPTMDKRGRANRKILVFTAYSDTATYLYDSLQAWARTKFNAHIALVTGGGGNRTTLGDADFDSILTNFSPCSKQRDKRTDFPQDADIDILIATDCISEGQNLQDCDLLVNYDIHWNPVRIIQRFGRIDRIGSVNTTVRLVNFWPTQNLDNYIKLKTRVETRMALVDISATFGDNPLATEDGEVEDLIAAELHYRDKQLLRLKDEILDLEDLNEDGVSLTEFTLDEFRADLLRYLEDNRATLENAPLGLHTVVPADSDLRPGVIFCLRQNSGDASSADAQRNETGAINPLHPHYLVYLHDDGNVRLTFAQPKQILEALRRLCAGRTEAIRELCELFDRETADGEDMSRYNGLLQSALTSITQTFRRRAGAALTASRDALLPLQTNQPTVSDEKFELITWVIVKPPADL